MKTLLAILLLIPSLSLNNSVMANQNSDLFEFNQKVEIRDNGEIEIYIDSEFKNRGNEIYNIDDINDDGKDDFIISSVIDVSMYGKKHWDILYEDAIKLPLTPSYLIFSSDNSYSVAALPPTSWSKRMYFAKSFEIKNRKFIALARNGEVGKPDQNPGEEIAIIELDFDENIPNFPNIYFEEKRTVTSFIDSFIDKDQSINLLVSNYNKIQPTTHFKYKVYDSVIFKFDPEHGLTFSGLVPFTKDLNAHNSMKVKDLNNDGNLDFMGAAEIWHDHKSDFQDNKPGSYIVLDWLNITQDIESEKDIFLDQLDTLMTSSEFISTDSNLLKDQKGAIKILLDPIFGDHHTGWDLEYLSINNETYIIETSSQKSDQMQEKNFSRCALSFYRLNDAKIIDKEKMNKWFSIKPLKVFYINQNQCAMSKIYKYDLDKDGIQDIFFSQFEGKKNYYTFKDSQWIETKIPYNVIGGSLSSKEITYILLKNDYDNCSSLASINNWVRGRYLKILISKCI